MIYFCAYRTYKIQTKQFYTSRTTVCFFSVLKCSYLSRQAIIPPGKYTAGLGSYTSSGRLSLGGNVNRTVATLLVSCRNASWAFCYTDGISLFFWGGGESGSLLIKKNIFPCSFAAYLFSRRHYG
jgi:hypothetical protein